MVLRNISFLILTVSIVGCTSKKDIYTTPTFSKDGSLNCVIEIPAGTNKKIEFNTKTNSFEVDQRNGEDRIISFLPYPGNYGFVPSTLSNTSKGGDGDALDILLISESLPTGTIVEVIPIGLLKLLDNGEYDYKIICTPKDSKKRIIDATTYSAFSKKYSHAKDIIASWFLHYDIGGDTLTNEGWGDEKEALEEIRKSLKT